jgi:hypothetical protein
MSNDAALKLHRQVISNLENNTDLQLEMGGQFQLFDQSDKTNICPRIVLGDTKSFAWHSATFDGQEHELLLIVWSKKGGGDKAKSISSAVMGVLHNADFPIEGNALVDLQFEKSETRYMENLNLYQTIMYFKALTVAD